MGTVIFFTILFTCVDIFLFQAVRIIYFQYMPLKLDFGKLRYIFINKLFYVLIYLYFILIAIIIFE